MAKVYMLIGDYTEGTTVLKVFGSPASANKCALACEAHQAKKPTYPDFAVDTPENDAAFEKATAQTERWNKRHPGGPDAWYCDTFTVRAARVLP